MDNDIWRACLGFLRSERFHKHSPANHGIVQCGHGISPRPTWPKDIYRRLLDSHVMPSFPIPATCTNYIDGVIDCTSLTNLRQTVKQCPDFDEDTDEYKGAEFLEDLFKAV
ncbi:unnamed protein product [Absidia cylindrospora]